MKKIVITGGAGFIGLNLVNNLIKKKKYKIFVLDALKYSSNKTDIKKIKKEITFYKLDITDTSKVNKILNFIKPDISKSLVWPKVISAFFKTILEL